MNVRRFTWLLGLLSVCVVVCWSCPALAQTIAITKTAQSTYLANPDGSQYSHSYTPSTTQLLWVNKKECAASLVYHLSITATGIQGLPMEVYAAQTGQDCTSNVNRITTPVCWKVFSDIAQNGTYSIEVPVQSVVAQITSSNGLASYYKGQPSDCDKAALAVPSGGVGITLSVFVYSGLTTGTPTYSDSWDQFGFDLIGPNPPATVTTGIADSELHLHWSSVLDSDRAGFNIYCEKAGAPIDAGVSDSGVQIATGGAATGGAASGTGGAATGSTGGTTSTLDAGVENLGCPITSIAQGIPPTGISPKGSASTITATDAYAHGLDNGISYACAVSVTDVMQNDGPLSTVVCGTPKPVDDFYTSYRNAGGKAGGGFCSIRKPGVGVGPMIALASLAMLALRRRRRSKVENGDGTR